VPQGVGRAHGAIAYRANKPLSPSRHGLHSLHVRNHPNRPRPRRPRPHRPYAL